MSDGNKRYLGDVFINEENYERQRQFFKDVIESYQHKHGGDFDAHTLQGLEPEKFATKEQGEKADLAILSPLLLGKTEITNIANSQYIYTDAIKLDRGATNKLDIIQWYNNLENDDITDALESIYNNVIDIQETLEGNLNDFITSDYTPLKTFINDNSETFLDNDDNEVTKLNASLVNGIRFILITQEEYDELPNEIKNYWRNFFIIKDSSEIPPDYEDPMSWKLTDGYIFAIIDDKLKVKHRSSNEWMDICSLSDFLNGANFDSIIEDFIQENSEYTINSDSLDNSIQNIQPTTINNHWEDYPFLSSSLHDNFVENISINGSSTNISESIDENNGFKNVNIDMNSIINPITTEINNAIDIERQRLDTANTSINSLQNQINNINTKNNNQDISLSDINNQLTNIGNQITSINNNIRNITNSLGSTWVRKDSQQNQNFAYYVNEDLKLVYFYVYAIIDSNSSTWKNISDLPAIKEDYCPKYSVYFASSTLENVAVALQRKNADNAGRFKYRAKGITSGNLPLDVYVCSIYTYA